MKREAVQEERHRYKQRGDDRSYSPSFYEFKEESESVNELNDDVTLTPEDKSLIERIVKAEDSFNPEKINTDPNVII